MIDRSTSGNVVRLLQDKAESAKTGPDPIEENE